MTSKWGHTSLSDVPNRAAGGTPLAELPSQRQQCNHRRAVLRLCSRGDALPSCSDTRDGAQTQHCCSAIALRYCQEVTLQWEIPNSLIFALFRRININKRSSARSQLRAGLPARVGLPSVEGGDVQELLCFSIDPSIPHSPWSQQ